MKTELKNHSIVKVVLTFLLGIYLSACAQERMQSGDYASEPQHAPGKNFIADWDESPHAAEWSSITVSAIESSGQDMVLMEKPDDASSFCPRFKHLSYEQRIQFYLMLISSMARYESGFRPHLKYVESFKDRKGRSIVSRGLLQMSLESAKAYGCELQGADDLHNPQKNLSCGVKILNRWIAKDRKIGSYAVLPTTGEAKHLGGNRYWAVLRKKKWGREKIQAKTLALDFCKDRYN